MIQLVPIGNDRIIAPGATRDIQVRPDESSTVTFVGGSVMAINSSDTPDYCRSILASPAFVEVEYRTGYRLIINLSFFSQMFIDDSGDLLIEMVDSGRLTFHRHSESQKIFCAIETRMAAFNELMARARSAAPQPDGTKRTAAGLIIP